MAEPPTVRSVLSQAAILLLLAGGFALAAACLIPLKEQGVIALAAALRQQPPPLWIDARPAAEFEGEHIPGALWLDAENWTEQIPRVLEAWEPGRVAVVYCNTPLAQASREVAERLREFKLGTVYVLHGGWKAWKQK